MNLSNLLQNYKAGNLSTAKAQAKRVSLDRLIAYLKDYYSATHALAIASYLKGKLSFQSHCDILNH